MIWAVDASSGNDGQPEFFLASTLHRHERSVFEKRNDDYMELSKEMFLSYGMSSNEYSAEEQHHPYNHELVLYHDVSTQLRRKGQIKETGDKR